MSTCLPESYLISPIEDDIIYNPNPLLKWPSLDISNYPYGDLVEGSTIIQVADLTADREVWNYTFDDLTTSHVNYNFNGNLFDIQKLLILFQLVCSGKPCPMEMLWGVVMISEWLENF